MNRTIYLFFKSKIKEDLEEFYLNYSDHNKVKSKYK